MKRKPKANDREMLGAFILDSRNLCRYWGFCILANLCSSFLFIYFFKESVKMMGFVDISSVSDKKLLFSYISLVVFHFSLVAYDISRCISLITRLKYMFAEMGAISFSQEIPFLLKKQQKSLRVIAFSSILFFIFLFFTALSSIIPLIGFICKIIFWRRSSKIRWLSKNHYPSLEYF